MQSKPVNGRVNQTLPYRTRRLGEYQQSRHHGGVVKRKGKSPRLCGAGFELTRMVECEDVIGKIENRTLPMQAGPLPFHVYTPMAADEPSGGVTLCRHHVHRIGAAQSEAAGPSQRTIDASEVCAPVLKRTKE